MNGVSPMVDFEVVRMDLRMAGSSFTHLPMASSSCFQPIGYDFVWRPNLSIYLWIGHGSEGSFTIILGEIIVNFIDVELWAIVENNSPWDAKSFDDIFQMNFLTSFSAMKATALAFEPLNKVFNCICAILWL